ncbi:MAG: hypothetical protein ABI172_00425 [Ginsengibacter sp.]
MKPKLIYILLITFLISFSSSAQQKQIKFHSINQFGIVFGESEENSVFQTINGIQFSNWFSAIGIGVDDYRYKTLPLFIEGRRCFGDENKGFVYADLGYNFPLKNKPGKEVSYYDSYHFKGGIYTDVGVGFKVRLINKSSFLFSLGYSYKELQTQIGVAPLCLGCSSYLYNYKFGYGRMILKAGVEF